MLEINKITDSAQIESLRLTHDRFHAVIFPDDINMTNIVLNAIMSIENHTCCVDFFFDGNIEMFGKTFSNKSITIIFYDKVFDSLFSICNKFKVMLNIRTFLLYNSIDKSFYSVEEKE